MVNGNDARFDLDTGFRVVVVEAEIRWRRAAAGEPCGRPRSSRPCRSINEPLTTFCDYAAGAAGTALTGSRRPRPAMRNHFATLRSMT
jgi:hypothetical protein